MTTTYTPMANDRCDFDPTGEWSYILDETPADAWRGMVAKGLRHATWPFASRGHSRTGEAHYWARLAPDWCFYAWGNEYVLAGWTPADGHVVSCRTTLERRYAPAGEVSDWPRNPFAGEGNDRWRTYGWTARITLDLRSGTWELAVTPDRTNPPAVPADVQAEAEHKAAKLLAFFRASLRHWRDDDQERPVQAYDLYKPAERDS